MMTKLKLTVNETKTRIAKLPEEELDFSGLYVRPLLLQVRVLAGGSSGKQPVQAVIDVTGSKDYKP